MVIRNFFQLIFGWNHITSITWYLQSQTEDPADKTLELLPDTSPALSEFLRKIEPLVVREIKKSANSRAFEGKAQILFTDCVWHMF